MLENRGVTMRLLARRGTMLALMLAMSACAVPGASVPGQSPSTSATLASAPPSTSPPPTQSTGTPTATVPATSPSASAARKLTVVMGGDMLWHLSLLSSVHADAVASGSKATYDFAPLFAGAKSLVTGADLAICNQEIPILAPGQEPSGYPTFGAPYEVARATAEVGFDACTTASNHSYDKGEAGLKSTLTALADAGIASCGTAADRASGEKPCLVRTASGATVGLVTGAWGLNGGTQLPEWQYNTFKPEAMIARAKAARAAGAEIVLGSIHAGDEYVTRPNADQLYVARLLAQSGEFDLVYGHHAHVAQPWTKINGIWVVYGLGNFVGQMNTNTPNADEGVLARFTFERDAAGRFRVTQAGYAPLFVTHADDENNARLLHVTDPAATRYASQERLDVARQRLKAAVGSLGATGIVEG